MTINSTFSEGGESQNGDEDSSESDGDESSLTQEPKTLRNPSTGGSQPGSTVHRPRGTVRDFFTFSPYTEF